MSVDLRSNSTFSRCSLLLTEDSLVKLDHGRTEDRVRRFRFDSIESVVVWRRVPWLRVTVCAALLVLPGAAVLFISETFATGVGVFLIALGLGLIAWYLYCRSTTIRIARGGETYDITGVYRPRRFVLFRDRLLAGIRAAQPSATGPTPDVRFEGVAPDVPASPPA